MTIDVFEAWIIYGFTLFFIYWLARLAKRYKIAMSFLILLPSVVVGLRGSTVGGDTAGYIQIFQELQYYGISKNIYSEIGFQFICKIIITLTNSVHAVMFAIALFTYSLYYSALYKAIANKKAFAFACFALTCFVFFPSLSGIRQILACAILFYGYVSFYDRKKYIKYIITVIVASTIHTAAIVGFLIVFGAWFASPRISKVKKVIIVIAGVILAYFSYEYLVSTKYGHLLERESTRSNSVGLYYIVLLLVSTVLYALYLKERRNENEKTKSAFYLMSFESNALIGMLFPILQMMSGITHSFGRISWFFVGSWAILVAKSLYIKYYKQIIVAIVFALCLYSFISIMLSNGYHQIPYKFL